MKKYISKIISKDIYERISNLYKTLLFYTFRVAPINEKKIVVSNFINKSYGDNPKYIVDELIKQKLGYRIIWLVSDIKDSNFPKEIQLIQVDSIRAIYELATAKLWIDNVRKLGYVRKRKNQYYIQTWHGSLGVKKVEKDAENALSNKYIKVAKRDSKMADLFISNGEFISNLYKNSFWYKGEILKVGSPRNDILINTDVDRDKIKEELGIPKDKKIALFAPTFRNSLSADVYDLDYEKCKEALQNKFSSEWIFLLRLHPNMADKVIILNYDYVYNVTAYCDMQELLLISDVLITDYSSSAFDFALKNNPCFLYVPDEKEYAQERSFYFNLTELPFPKANTNIEIANEIFQFNENTYVEEIERFFKKQGILEDGMASKRVVEKIKQIMG